MLKIAGLVSFIILNSLIFCQTSDTNIKQFSLEKGLSQSNVRCLLLDKTGFLWLGTEDGLNRYDGYNFKIYKNEPGDTNSLSADYINCLLEDKNGNLWVGTSGGGLNKFNPFTDRFTRYLANKNNKNLLQSNVILSLTKDRAGNILVGTYLGGLSIYSFKDSAFTTYTPPVDDNRNLSSLNIMDIYEDDKSNLWLATFEAGVCYFNIAENKLTRFEVNNSVNSINSNTVFKITPFNSDTLFIGTDAGINVFSIAQKKFLKLSSVIPAFADLVESSIKSIFVDKKECVWLGSVDKGVILFDKQKNKIFHYNKDVDTKYSAISSEINQIIEDNSGLIWVGTHTGGVFQINLNPKRFGVYKKETGDNKNLSSESVRSFYKDSFGNLWVGTDNGLNRIEENTGSVKRYYFSENNKNSLSNNSIWAITGDNIGNLWIGTQNGLNKFNIQNNSFVRFTYAPMDSGSFPTTFIRCLHYDKNDVLWIGTFGSGLIKFDIKKKMFLSFVYDPNDNSSISDNVVLNLFEDSSGNFWVSTAIGLNDFDRTTGKFIRYNNDKNNENSISEDKVLGINEDGEGNIWIGTFGGGLNKFLPKDKKFIRFSEKDGLPNNVVYGILTDTHNNLWMSTNQGICKFDVKKKKFKSYTWHDGLQSNEFNAGAFYKNNDGKFFFGGIKGFNAFYPDQLNENEVIPPIVITNFQIYNEPYAGLNYFYDNQKVMLSYDENYFSFEYAALNFLDSEKNQYAYQLEGIDDKWIYAGTRRYCSYSEIKPGEYIFRVKASNNDGLWNDKGIAVFISIYPPFWETWLFRILLSMILIFIIAFIYKRRVEVIKKNAAAKQRLLKQLIETQENERKRIASELHDGLGHSLLIISNMAQAGLKNPDTAVYKKNLDRIHISAKEAIEEVRKMAYNLHPYHLDELGLTTTIQSMLDRLTENVPFQLSIYVENIDNCFGSEEQIIIFRIVQEGMNNIIKHAEARSAVVSVSRVNGSVQIIVKDDGKGIENFDSEFYGFGLSKMCERVNVLSGTINIESAYRKGTLLKIEIPIK